MQQVTADKKDKKKKSDPAPSKWAYRVNRIWLTPRYRLMLRIVVPFGVVFTAATMFLSDPARQDQIKSSIADMRREFETRPEFMVKMMAVDGASAQTARMVRANVGISFPQSTFDLDLDSIRRSVLALPSISDASVRVRENSVLQIEVSERKPAILWRNQDEVVVLDIEGVTIGSVLERSTKNELALIAGDGANAHVDEALAVLRAAKPLQERLRGLIRMGERRWDVVLDRGQRIMLPEDNPVRALERVIILSQAEDMLGRDLSVVDVRYGPRPTLRMNKPAVDQWWRIREMTVGNSN